MKSENILYEVVEGRARITLNRPEKRNALSDDLLRDLEEALWEADDDTRVHVVIIRGAGGEERRPVVLMNLCMGNTIYEEQFTLNDRSDMIYPVLLGRRTLSHLGYLDVTQTFTHSPDCDEGSIVKLDKDQKDDEDIED